MRTTEPLVIGVALIALACGGGGGSGAGGGGAKDGGPIDLAGTRWAYDQVEGGKAYEVDFVEGGYYHRHRYDNDSDSWKQSGSTVSMVINDKVTFDGTMIGDHTIYGEGDNPGTAHWNYRLLRLPSPAEAVVQGPNFELPGTFWKLDATGGGKDTKVWILPDEWAYKGDNNDAPDTWSKSGDKVTVSINGGAATYDLKLHGDHTMVGTAKGTGNSSWQLRLERIPAPGEFACDPYPSDFTLPGSLWKIETVGANVPTEWEMLPDGKVYNSKNATNPEPDTWKRTGDTVTVSINGGFAVWEGDLIGSHSIVGWATNKNGDSWYFRALRTPGPAEVTCY